MKRSAINGYIGEAKELFARIQFKLPPFAYWSCGQWQNMGPEADEIRDNRLGWDVTDFGCGSFEKTGLLLFTVRNGNCRNRKNYPKGYAEKIMMVRELQVTPWHYHCHKREDIINRGGGNLVIELNRTGDNNGFSDQPLTVSVDGIARIVAPGGTVVLQPGESICLEPYVYHTFFGEPGRGPVVVGEVSDVNDDESDNCFRENLGRFPEIEEDEQPVHYLCTEYP